MSYGMLHHSNPWMDERADEPDEVEPPPDPEQRTIKWYSHEMTGGTTRHRLFVSGVQTPWFVDHAHCRAHFTQGEPCGLFGSGMGSEICTGNGSGYRIAGCFGGFRTLAEAKRRAEELEEP